jgi:hypothetical protein
MSPSTLLSALACPHRTLAVDPELMRAQCDECGEILSGTSMLRAVLALQATQRDTMEVQLAELQKLRRLVVKLSARLMDHEATD